MGRTVGDFWCERRIQWGVHTIYGFLGDGVTKAFAVAPEEGLPGAIAVLDFPAGR